MTYRIAIGPSSFADKDDTPLRMLAETGAKIIPNPFGRRLTEDEIISHLDGVDGLIAGLEPLNRRVISSAKQLKAIARVGIGVENVDFDATVEYGIKVSSTPDGPTHAVAELTLACMLATSRNLLQMNDSLHRSKWDKMISPGLLDTPVLFIGYGRIGREVAKRLSPFGPKILIYDPYISPEEIPQEATSVSLDEGLEQSKIITLHASGNETVLGEPEFGKMSDGIIILNSARADLVDEQAMIYALKSGKIAGAWFDAFWEEPYSGPLLDFPNVLLTPHVGTYTKSCRLMMESEAVKNLLRDLKVL